jgi:addiction module HigA family antidote
MSWDIRFSRKVVKQIRDLPESVQMTVKFLVKDLQINGPMARTWPNFGKRAITPDTAFRLARFFETTPEFWLGLQTDVSLWDTWQAHGSEYEKIKTVRTKA